VQKPILIIFISILLAACSPKFDWRQVQGSEAPYTVLMPGKTSELSRDIQLGPDRVTMTMTATQIDGVSFAVGATKMSDATKAMQTLSVIKTALINNLGGKIIHEEGARVSNSGGKLSVNSSFSAISTKSPLTSMTARLLAQDVWIFQILVVGPEKDINKEAVETFLNSFKLAS
jgi:hypothetical protein